MYVNDEKKWASHVHTPFKEDFKGNETANSFHFKQESQVKSGVFM